MGGRGSASRMKSNVIRFSGYRQEKTQDKKWDYRGYKENVDKIENAVKGANTRQKEESAYRAINSADKNITSEIERVRNGIENGDISVLMTQRRRLRQLKRRLTRK